MGLHHLRGQEGWGAIAPLQVLVPRDDDLAAPKVAERDVAASAHEHILGLQIPMHHVVVVQVVQGLQAQTEAAQAAQVAPVLM